MSRPPLPVQSRHRVGEPGKIEATEGDRLTVLVVGTDDWAIEQGAESLEGAGHRVVRCHEPGQPAFPCNALRDDAVCPLDLKFNLVVTMRSRPLSPPGASEFGVICGLRSGVALLVGGVTAGNPFEPWAAGTIAVTDDLATAVDRVRRR